MTKTHNLFLIHNSKFLYNPNIFLELIKIIIKKRIIDKKYQNKF